MHVDMAVARQRGQPIACTLVFRERLALRAFGRLEVLGCIGARSHDAVRPCQCPIRQIKRVRGLDGVALGLAEIGRANDRQRLSATHRVAESDLELDQAASERRHDGDHARRIGLNDSWHGHAMGAGLVTDFSDDEALSQR